MDTLIQDFKSGVRMLLSRPGFTLVTAITLALGIGANTAIFSITDKLLIRSLPVEKPDQLVLINSVSVSPHFVSNAFSYPIFKDYRDQNDVFSGMFGFTRTQLELNTNDQTEQLESEYVSSNYFEVLGVKASLGRVFSGEEDLIAGPAPVVMLSDAFWRTHFGADPSVIGKSITLNNVPLTVIGVAPPEFGGMILEEPAAIWVPVRMHSQLAQSKFIESRKDAFLRMVGRIKDGISTSQAQIGMDLVAQQVKQANTPAGVTTKGLPFGEQHIQFEPGGQGISLLRKRFSSPLKLLMAVVALVLLIACTNVAGLLLARGLARRKELAIRRALGAGPFRLARQLMTESLLLAGVGGAAGLLLAPWLVTLLVKSQSRLSLAQGLLGEGLDRRVLAFSIVTTLLAGLLFGAVPAWQGAKSDLLPALKDDVGISIRGEHRFNIRNLLVVTQLALAVIVLIGAGLCIKSLQNLLAIDPGYQSSQVIMVPLELDEKKYDAVRGQALKERIIERLRSLPVVDGVSYGLVMPLSGSRYMSTLFVVGRQPLPDEQMAFDSNDVGPRYHETMGIKILEGRGFTEQDREGAPGVVIINEAMARKLFPGEDAVGKRLQLGTNAPALEVVGIAANIKIHDLTEEPIPHFDLPSLQRSYGFYTNIVVRTKGKANDSISATRDEVKALDPSLPVSDVKSMSDQIGNALSAMRMASTLVGIFGVVALLLAAIGLYGVMAYAVAQRTREIGIRMALGAQVSDVLGMIIRQGMTLTGIGVVLGLAAAYILARTVSSFLYGVSPTDPGVFAIIGVVLLGVALGACFVPARRASKVDPMIALRYE
jgi:macrolide transport system ATP-binding/permease protein